MKPQPTPRFAGGTPLAKKTVWEGKNKMGTLKEIEAERDSLIMDISVRLGEIAETLTEDSIDPNYEELGPCTDVRLQITSQGEPVIHIGDASYDTDHRGYWGSVTLFKNATRAECTELATDLVDQALDMLADEEAE